MKLRILAGIVLIGVLAGAPAHAARLFGIVSTADGKPAQTTVVLKDATGLAVGQPLSTDKTGAYDFKDIKPGSYQVFINEKNTWKIFVGTGETRRDFTLK
ncbi:MAG TPA: hypothetical protein PLB81_04205 [Deltaproteobacteria bacterium]|nr:hypothetical protein [Deltaproteobacteria bacterium]